MTLSYALWMTASALISAIMYFSLAKGLKKRGLLAGLTLLLGIVLGVVCARVSYCVLQLDYVQAYGLNECLFSDDMSMLSYYGGMAGVVLAAVLAAKCTGNKVMDALNAFAPAGALMAALARFGEYFLDLLCAGRYIEDERLFFFPLAVPNEFDEWYVAVFMIAGLFSLVAAGLSLFRFKEKRFLRTLFYLCLPQIFCESLRNQSLIWTEFLRVEQLFCMIAMEVILILYGIWAKGQKKRFLPAIVGLICAGVFVAVEFALDKTNIPHVITYGVMILGLAVLAWMECLGFKKVKAAGKA